MATTYNYLLSNFLATPNPDDVRLRIYEKTGKLRYTIDPNISYFFTKSNIVIINVEDRNSIQLDFPNSSEAAQALAKLNQAKKDITNPGCHPEPIVGENIVFSKMNLEMSALVTSGDSSLACNTAILDTPKLGSIVRVAINGVEVNVGGKTFPNDCYFSPDGGVSVRSRGDERLGDKLYWNGSIAGYQLDAIDLIDFIYLIVLVE